MELPEWSGERQRASLTGFARVRAVMWRRSLRIFEWWRLRREPWFGPLRRELKREFAKMDTFEKERVKTPPDVFGETPILTIVTLLNTLAKLNITATPPFVDLGSGRGVTCLAAASQGWSALGFEQEYSWVRAAQEVARKLSLDAEFRAGDFTQQEWPEQGTFLVVATAFDDDLKATVSSRLRELEIGVVITVDWALGVDAYNQVWQAPLPVDWGTAHFRIYRWSQLE